MVMHTAVIVLVAVLASLTSATHITVIDIGNIGFPQLETLKSSLQVEYNGEWWIEIGDKLLSYSNYPSAQTMERTSEPLFIVSKAHYSYLEGLEDKVILHYMGFAIIQASEDSVLATLTNTRSPCVKYLVEFNYTNLVLVKQSANLPAQQPIKEIHSSTALPTIQTLMGYVSQARWFSDVQSLASYNRYTKGSGISSAQKWITDQLSTLKNLTVTTQPFTSGSTSGVNIIATLKGVTQPNKMVIIGGHYDSTSQSPTTAAPGAEDDASGAAAVLEMARIFNAQPSPVTAVFIFFSGEEQGLLGSAAHAQSLVNAGKASEVQLMHNMDMIAYQKTANAKGQVILETVSTYSSLFPYYRTSAKYTTLELSESLTAWGSDHESYIKRGMPGLLTIDKDWDSYPSYHKTTDTVDKLTPALGYQIIKLGVGAVAQVLGFSA